MQVEPDTPYRVDFQQHEYLFCSEHCLHKFAANSAGYIADSQEGRAEQAAAHPHVDIPELACDGEACGLDTDVIYTCPMHPEIEQHGPGTCPKCGMALEPKSLPPVRSKTEYTCPMHPEIVQDHPGTCPKCGMALEPRTVAAKEDDSELKDMTRRFWVSSVLALPVLFSAMGSEFWPDTFNSLVDPKLRQWLEFILASPVVLWGGWPLLVRGVQSVKTWNLNMFTLIGLGVSVAWVYSVVALLLPGIFPETLHTDSGVVPVYFEAAGVITALVLLGQVLELRARSQTNAAIKLLLGLAPKTARIVRDDGS